MNNIISWYNVIHNKQFSEAYMKPVKSTGAELNMTVFRQGLIHAVYLPSERSGLLIWCFSIWLLAGS